MSKKEFALYIEDLTVSFDGFKAIDSLNLYVDKDELRVIIGPNGAGKTTLLDLICGKTKASAGSIKFKDEELTKQAEHKIVRAGVGRKFQTPSIYENLSVFQNLEVSFPRGRSVLGPWASNVRTRSRPECRPWPKRSAWPTSSRARLVCSPTARSNGWRSACC
jgi:urea transport system ATP-binding protein